MKDLKAGTCTEIMEDSVYCVALQGQLAFLYNLRSSIHS